LLFPNSLYSEDDEDEDAEDAEDDREEAEISKKNAATFNQ